MPVQTKDHAPITLLPEVPVAGATGPPSSVVGPAGHRGAASATGATGPVGITGPFGVGPTGPGAFTGPTGHRGATGPTGAGDAGEGFMGDYGAGGDPGVTGPSGATGRTGPIGQPGGPSGVTGPAGLTGVGNYGGLQTPFFVDPEVYLTAPTLHFGNNMGTPWGYAGFTAATIYLVPVFIPYARKYTSMVIDSYELRAWSVYFKLGIYDCTPDMHPTTAVYSSGDITPAGRGRMSVIIDVDLQAKPYYLAFICTDTEYFRVWVESQLTPSLGWRKTADNSGWQYEAVSMQTAAFWFGYPAGFVDLTNIPIGGTATQRLVLSSGNVLMIGIR